MMKALTKKRNDKGFTLVELIVVIAILAVLMAILVPQYIQYVERSRQGTDASALGEVKHAVEIEAALQTAPATISVTNSGGVLNVTDGATGDPKAFTDAVKEVVGKDIALQSSYMEENGWTGGTLTVNATTGAVTWDKTTEGVIKNLTAGSAKKS